MPTAGAACSPEPTPPPQVRPVAESDWAEAWKVGYQTVRFGRLVVIPTWIETPLAAGEVPLRLEPGMAFGTGTHPSTQLCLLAVEQFAAPGKSVIDLGCGSGILAIAAVKLGCAPALGVDIDPQAVAVARQNAAVNGVAGQLRLEAGSQAEILSGAFGQQQGDLVLANILARVLVLLAGQGLAQLVAPGGLLVASGILAEQAAEVETAFTAAGLAVRERRQMGDWVAVLAERPAALV